MEKITRILDQLSYRVKTIGDDYEISYKGYGDSSWKEQPTLFREASRLQNEDKMVSNVVRNYYDEFAHANTIDILTQMQHYEAPTRLFDVTTNVLVALFFACGGWEKVLNPAKYEELSKIDGKLSIYKVKKEEVKSIDSETVTLIANIAKMKYSQQAFGQLMWLCERDWKVWQNEDHLVLKNKEDVNKVIYVKTKLNNPRVRAQHGDFFLFGGLSGLNGLSCPQCLREKKVTKIPIVFPDEYKAGDIPIRWQDKKAILESLEKYFSISFATMCPEKQNFIKVVGNQII